jgi:hypothetical protein
LSLVQGPFSVALRSRLICCFPQGELYVDFVRATRSVADALLLFPSARPPLPYLLDMIPCITPRAYSITSTPRAHGRQVHLCVLIDQWRTPPPEETRRYVRTYSSKARRAWGDAEAVDTKRLRLTQPHTLRALDDQLRCAFDH